MIFFTQFLVSWSTMKWPKTPQIGIHDAFLSSRIQIPIWLFGLSRLPKRLSKTKIILLWRLEVHVAKFQ